MKCHTLFIAGRRRCLTCGRSSRGLFGPIIRCPYFTEHTVAHFGTLATILNTIMGVLLFLLLAHALFGAQS